MRVLSVIQGHVNCVIVSGVRQPSRKGSSATIGEMIAAKLHCNMRPDYRISAIECDAMNPRVLAGVRR